MVFGFKIMSRRRKNKEFQHRKTLGMNGGCIAIFLVMIGTQVEELDATSNFWFRK
jgi:hypothetical protein